MKNYLDSGKSLYIEGNDLFRDLQSTSLFDYLGARYLGDGEGVWVGNISSLRGVDGSIAQGLAFSFPQWGHPDEKPDQIEASEKGRLLLVSQDGVGRMVSDDGHQPYRLIASSVAWGALKPNDTPPDILLQKIVDYLIR